MPKPFKINRENMTAVARMGPEKYLKGLLENVARVNRPEDMPDFFKGLKQDGRYFLPQLAMTRRGRRLIIDYLQAEYLAQLKELEKDVQQLLKSKKSKKK